MDEKIAELLAKIVEQNERVLDQNQRLIGFLETRDARIPERTELEIENLKIRNANERHALADWSAKDREQTVADEEWKRHPGALDEVIRESVREKIDRANESASWREKKGKTSK